MLKDECSGYAKAQENASDTRASDPVIRRAGHTCALTQVATTIHPSSSAGKFYYLG